MRDGRSTVSGASDARNGHTETPRSANGEIIQRPPARLRRIGSSLFGSNAEQTADAGTQGRRNTVVGALLRAKQSLLNLVQRRDASEPESADRSIGDEDGDESEAESVSTVRALDGRSNGEPRESVEEPLHSGSSLYSRRTHSGSEGDRSQTDNGTGEDGASANSDATVNTTVRLPSRTLRRTGQSTGTLRQSADESVERKHSVVFDAMLHTRKSLLNLYNRRSSMSGVNSEDEGTRHFLDSLKNVQTAGDTPNDALASLDGDAESVSAFKGVAFDSVVATDTPVPFIPMKTGANIDGMSAYAKHIYERSCKSLLAQLSELAATAATEEGEAVVETELTAEKWRKRLSALSMRDLMDRYAFRRRSKTLTAMADEDAVSPTSGAPGNGLDTAAESTQMPNDDLGIRNDSAMKRSSGEAAAKPKPSAIRPAHRRRATTEVQAEVAHLTRMLNAKPDMTLSRSRSSTLECELAFDPQWRPDDPREYSRRHRLSNLYGSEALDVWELERSWKQ